jgi:hypothetical protein
MGFEDLFPNVEWKMPSSALEAVGNVRNNRLISRVAVKPFTKELCPNSTEKDVTHRTKLYFGRDRIRDGLCVRPAKVRVENIPKSGSSFFA